MGGAGLGRLWSSHPRVAFAVHLLVTVIAGYAAFEVALSGAGWGALFVVAAFLLLAASLVFLTLAAVQGGWQPDATAYDDGRGQVVSPRAAWANTRDLGRIVWVLFAVAFVSALALLLDRSIVGFVLLVIALVLAIVAMRTD